MFDSTAGPEARQLPAQRRPAPPQHTLSDIDPATMTAACKACGDGVAIRPATRPGSMARVLDINFICAKKTPVELREPLSPGASNPSIRAKRLRSRFQMTEAEYDALWTSQGGLCAICCKPPEPGRMLAVDHDPRCCPASARRTCGLCVRGLVCTLCNWGLGHFLDDPTALLRAATYTLKGRNTLMPSDVIADAEYAPRESAA